MESNQRVSDAPARRPSWNHITACWGLIPPRVECRQGVPLLCSPLYLGNLKSHQIAWPFFLRLRGVSERAHLFLFRLS
eukprot:6631225-Pyramimonas_sp.AAC.1